MMSVRLSADEREMLAGRDGEAVRTAMEILVKMGDMYGAPRLLDVDSVHLVLAMYKSIYDAGVEVVEKFAALGGKFKVPTTLDPCGMDTERWQEFKTPADYAEKQLRVMRAYEKMGAIPIWTCTPYLTGNLPRFGQHVAWTESSAVCFINSVIGARSNRETAVIDVAAGLTGKIPEHGLHLAENRRGRILIEVDPALRLTARDVVALGYFVGKRVGSKIPVVVGLDPATKIDTLKAMMAALAASGGVALCLLVGLSPEARTVEEAFQGRKPEEVISFGAAELEATRGEMSTVRSGRIDLVAVGCPHYSLAEVGEVLRLLDGRHVAAGTEFWIYLTKQTATLAERLGYREALERLGVRFALETCMLISPVETWGFKTLMTDSGKCAYYAPMQCKTEVVFGSTAECVEAAVSGRVG